jgi:hypothetical protein
VTRTPSNFAAARSQTFPRDLPVLLVVVSTNAELPGWVHLHEQQLTQVDRSELMPLVGGHYQHHTKSAQIAAAVTEFLG